MRFAILITLAIVLLHSAMSYSLGGRARSLARSTNVVLRLSSEADPAAEQEELYYTNIAVSGFVSKEANVAEAFIFDKLHDKAKFNVITSITDDVQFARKRLVTPRAVYSGLNDILAHEVVAGGSLADLAKVVGAHEAWLCGNIKPDEVQSYVDIAVGAAGSLKRVVFGVNYSGVPNERTSETFSSMGDRLKAAGVAFTFVKYAELMKLVCP